MKAYGVLTDDDRLFYEDTEGGDDSLEMHWYEDGILVIELDSPWAGDTERGFGETVMIWLRPAVAGAVIDWLVRTRRP